MQGVHAFEPKTKANIDLESFVAEDHFLRRINRVLDLSFIRELTTARYSDGQGRPSIDPEVYFRMQLVAYFYGIAKDRRLCEEVRYNLAYRWFCRLSLDDDVPDHSSLTHIRDRLGEEVFEAVFRRIVAQCQQKGLIKDPCRVMTDATLIPGTTLQKKPSRRRARAYESFVSVKSRSWTSKSRMESLFTAHVSTCRSNMRGASERRGPMDPPTSGRPCVNRAVFLRLYQGRLQAREMDSCKTS
jgi:transposase